MNLPEFFGLDIGNHSIKVAQVKQGGKPVLEKIGSIETSLGMSSNIDSASIIKLADYIKEVHKASGISTKKVVAALPESMIFSRVLEIPLTKDEGKIEETIYWEAKQYIPIDIEDVQLDWIRIQEKKVGTNSALQLLLVAAPKASVAQYKELIEKAGMELIALETESIATARAISFKRESSSSILILDFGANGTDMSVVKTGNLIFAQSLGTGSDALTKAIQNDYGITEQQAEQYKRSYGLLADQGEGKILKSLSPVMDIIVNEINKTVNYFKANIQEGTPQLIYVVGDGAKLPGLAEFLSQKLGIQSQIADPTEFLGITNSIKGEVEQMNAVGFTVALGLAMKTE